MILSFITNAEKITSEKLEQFKQVLDVNETNRLSNLKTIKRQREFIIGRMLIKTVCAHYFKMTADKIEIGIHENRAPFLPQYSNYFISLSHSKEYVVMALSDNPVGIDIEQNKNRSIDDLMKRLFDDKIPSDWPQLSEAERQRFFYTCWTEFEACFKLKSIQNKGGKIYSKTFYEPENCTTTISSYNSINTNIKEIELD